MFYFVTGPEGCGKSTIIPYLQRQLSGYIVVDFDNVLRSYDFAEGWSNEVLDHVISKFQRYDDVVVVGLTNLEQIDQRLQSLEYNVILLSVSQNDRAARLSQRGAEASVIKDIEYLTYFQQIEIENKSRILSVIDTSLLDPESVATQVISVIKGKSKKRIHRTNTSRTGDT